MNWLDILLAVILVIAVFIGLRRGLIKTVFALVGLVLGVFVAGRLYEPFGDWLSSFMGDSIARIVAYAIILICVLVLAAVLASFVRRTIALTPLGWVDSLVGGVLGLLVCGVLMAAVITLLARFATMPLELPEGTVPEEVRSQVEEFLGEVRIRESINTAFQDSEVASFFLEHFPDVLGLLPDEFEEVSDFFKD